MVKVEQFGSRQKRTCFGCGSIISFENNDIVEVDSKVSYVECPICRKHIKAFKVDREKDYKSTKDVTEVGEKIKDALNESEVDWGDED